MTARAVFPPGDARDDWAVLRALSGALERTLPFDSLAGLRRALYAAHPHLASLEIVVPAGAASLPEAGRPGAAAFAPSPCDFYLSNAIARASAVMAECSALARNNFKVAAE